MEEWKERLTHEKKPYYLNNPLTYNPTIYSNATPTLTPTLGLWKTERVITSKQSSEVTVSDAEGSVLNFCSNNYLGLSSDPRIMAAAQKALEERGFGLSSVRFICGTQDIHKELEAAISDFHGTEDTILYPR